MPNKSRKSLKPKRVRVVKVTPIEPEKTLVELEVEGPIPENIPAEPAEVETLKAADHPIVKWLKGLW